MGEGEREQITPIFVTFPITPFPLTFPYAPAVLVFLDVVSMDPGVFLRAVTGFEKDVLLILSGD